MKAHEFHGETEIAHLPWPPSIKPPEKPSSLDKKAHSTTKQRIPIPATMNTRTHSHTPTDFNESPVLMNIPASPSRARARAMRLVPSSASESYTRALICRGARSISDSPPLKKTSQLVPQCRSGGKSSRSTKKTFACQRRRRAGPSLYNS